MGRPRRILLNAATALSLVLCVVTVVLWERSYRTTEMFRAPPERKRSSPPAAAGEVVRVHAAAGLRLP